MTEPTWKDPLLHPLVESWAAELREDQRAALLSWFRPGLSTMDVLMWAKETIALSCYIDLRRAIDAELARGRRARGVARQWADISDDDNRDGARHVARLILEAFDGE
jgi:hypothetical protein